MEMDATIHGIVTDKENEDKPSKDVEVVDGQKLVHRVAADKEGDELVAWLLVSLYHQRFVPETSKIDLWYVSKIVASSLLVES